MKKNPSSFKKPRRSKRAQKRLKRKQQRSQSSSEFGYENLEPRYALDASFTFDEGNLRLFDFTDNVNISQNGNSFTAALSSGAWTFLEDGDPVDPADIPGNIIFGGGLLEVSGVNNSVVIEDALDVGQNGLINARNGNISIEGTGSVTLTGVPDPMDPSITLGNALGTLNVDVDGDVSVLSTSDIDGTNFIGANLTIITTGDVEYVTIGEPTTISVDIDAAEIQAGSVTTTFVPVVADFNQIGAEPVSSVRLRATGGTTAIPILDENGDPITDAPVTRDNTSGGITIDNFVISDQILLQSSDGIDIPEDGLDTLYLFLGGQEEIESRGEFQLNVPSLQELSANLYDGLAITSQQDLTIGAFEFVGTNPNSLSPFSLQFTEAFSDQYANITAVSLTFDAPFASQKLVADVTIDIDQNAGAPLNVDDVIFTAESVILDNVDNDFQRIAAVGRGFLVGDQQNNEDNLTIRDQGTLEIAVLDNQPNDLLVVNFANSIVPNTIEGITVAGQVDILTGFGGPIPVQPVDAVEPNFEQLGNTLGTDFRIERFEIPRERSGTQTGVFRDDNYNGAVRPVYFIEFFHDGTQDLVIRTDRFERGNPELVRGLIDVELALYNDLGELVAQGQEFDQQLEEIAFAANTLDAGRYFVAASAFSTEFEDDFVVNTANTQIGTLNVTITGNLPTPELSRDLTQAAGAAINVFGGDEPIPADSLLQLGPEDFPPEVLVQLDPNAAEFAPEPIEVDSSGNPVSRVGGRATLGAANGGTVQLALTNNNDVRELVVSEAGSVEFADIDDLVVSSLDVTGQSLLAAGRGGVGELIVGDVDSSTLLLQAASGVSQEGAITTNQLLLGGDLPIQGGGDFVILSDTLENVAFNLPAGNLALTTSQELNIGFVEFNDIENPLVPSFVFDESVVIGRARIEAASININTQVQAETLVLNAQDSIVQGSPVDASPGTPPELIPSTPSVVTPNLSVSATTVDLNQPENAFNRLAGNVSGSLDLLNSNPIVVATIDNTVEIETQLRPIGVTQTLSPLATIDGLTVVGTANITSGTVDNFLVVGGLTQEFDAPLNIGSANLTLLNDGDLVLLNPLNDINFNSTDARDVIVTLADGTTIAGITANRDLLIQGIGELTVVDANTVNGNITINTGDNVLIGEISANGSTTVISGGSINDFQGELSATGTIILDAVNDIDGIDFADQSVVVASSDAGDISLLGSGELTLQNVVTSTGAINVTTAGDVLVGSVASASTIDVDSAGSINDLQDDLAPDFSAGGLVTLVAVNEIGGGTTSTSIDSAGQLELSQGTVTVQSTEGDVSVGGDGPLIFGDIETPNELVISSPDSLTIGNVTALSADLSAVNDVTIANVTTVNDITITSLGAVETGALSANNVTVTAGDNARIASVTAIADATLNSQGLLNVTTLDAETASLTAAQNITFETANTVGDVIFTAGDGNLNGDTVVSATGTATLSSLQRVNVREATAFGDITLEAGNAVNSDLVVSQTGSAFINANGNLSARVVDAAVDAILIAPRSDVSSDSVTAGVSAQLTSGAFLFTRNVEAPDATLNAGTNQVAQRVIADTAEITAAGDLGLNDIQAGQLTIEAGDDIFDAGFLDGNRVTTSNLVIRAGNSNDEGTFGGVVLETDVDTLTVITEGDSFGNIIIRELDDIVLGDIEAGNGGINISAGGTISGGTLRTVVQNDSNDIRLTATGNASDISVDRIDVGNIGDAFLIADDDVVINGSGQLRADFIFVNARNQSVGETDGISLATDVITADLIVGDIADANQNRGDISITDVDTLNVNFARTLNGTIDATANGNLVTSNIQSTGVNVSDAISLRAIGTGADVVTNRVAVLQQAGGVVLTAGDDVRDANTQDNLLVIADNLTIFAGNNLTDTFDGINSQSRVRSINATAGGTLIPDGDQEGIREAAILINNTGQLTINEATTSSGVVRVINNNGFLTVADVNLTSTSTENRVFVQTTGGGSDIAVGNINAGLRGAVIIDSADDIFDTDQLDELFVEGRFLSATSRNGTDDPFDGIILNADVDSFVADAQRDGVAAVRQRG